MTKKDAFISIGSIILCVVLIASTNYRINKIKDEYEGKLDSLINECYQKDTIINNLKK